MLDAFAQPSALNSQCPSEEHWPVRPDSDLTEIESAQKSDTVDLQKLFFPDTDHGHMKLSNCKYGGASCQLESEEEERVWAEGVAYPELSSYFE